MEEVLHRALLGPLASPCSRLSIKSLFSEGLSDYQARAGTTSTVCSGAFARSPAASIIEAEFAIKMATS